jgi:uncharacterized protein (TIGR00661 family)
MKKGKIYLSDEGFGHIVRQSAIAKQLHKLDSGLVLQVQTHGHKEMAEKLFDEAELIDIYNNITWHKKQDGSPDLKEIESHYSTYKDRSNLYLLNDDLESVDFVLSDFVYEAFISADKFNIPSFGVAHFTWDWFFSKLYPPVLKTSLIHHFISMAKKATKLYFPPFTPQEILDYYGPKAVQVPLIVRKKDVEEMPGSNKLRILIIDSGASVLKQSIEKASKQFKHLSEFEFYLMRPQVEADNVIMLEEGTLLADYIPNVDLVIGRAGFNTISECIAYRTPMLLLGEAANPEMSENIINLKKSGLGSFMSLQDFECNLGLFLSGFISAEYNQLKKNMHDHSMQTNGAEVIAKDILNSI